MDHGITFTVSEFAEYSRTTVDTLKHYDRIGLLSPSSRGKNNYRYYKNDRLTVVNVIRTLQESGMTLGEIKELMDVRTPAKTDELFTNQIEKIDAIIEDWIRVKKLFATLRNAVRSAADINEHEIAINFMAAEAIVLGDLNDYSRGQNPYHALYAFYKNIREKFPDMDLNYPVWAVFSRERIKKRDWVWPDRYYFYNPEGHNRRPAALYAIGYKRGGYGQTDDLYGRIIDYIEKNNFEICGDAYEEYPLNEISTIDECDYLMRIMIAVREKNGDGIENTGAPQKMPRKKPRAAKKL